MVSTELFWRQVGAYNATTWPVAIAMVAAAAFLAFRVFFRPGARTDLWLKVFLSFAFAWNGIVFFLLFAIGLPLLIIGRHETGVSIRASAFRGRFLARLQPAPLRRLPGDGAIACELLLECTS